MHKHFLFLFTNILKNLLQISKLFLLLEIFKNCGYKILLFRRKKNTSNSRFKIYMFLLHSKYFSYLFRFHMFNVNPHFSIIILSVPLVKLMYTQYFNWDFFLYIFFQCFRSFKRFSTNLKCFYDFRSSLCGVIFVSNFGLSCNWYIFLRFAIAFLALIME